MVYHADLWGLRDEKYDWLLNRDATSTEWEEIHPRPEFYLFVPRDEAALERYNEFVKVTDIFPVHSVGIVTARDRLTIHWTPEEAWQTVVTFANMDPELARRAYKLGRDVRDWKVAWAQRDLKESGLNRDKIVPVLYRPFDIRYTYYTGNSRGFHCMPRRDVMQHMLAGENIALITSRLTKGETFKHAQVTRKITEVICMSSKTSNNGFVFPLYLYPDTSKRDLFSQLEPQEKRPNLNPAVVAALKAAYGQEPTPEDIFHYVYALLYAESYREKYAEFLKIDFPRVPFTADGDLFQALAALGRRLVDLHLLRSEELDPPAARFQGQGDNRVARTQREGFGYEPREERIYINKSQYFAPVPLELWEYPIGGYQALEKWLKDRRERRLSLEEIKTYCRVVTAIRRTIALQEEIDALYPEVEKVIVEGSGKA